jgi:hypothetical protein
MSKDNISCFIDEKKINKKLIIKTSFSLKKRKTSHHKTSTASQKHPPVVKL